LQDIFESPDDGDIPQALRKELRELDAEARELAYKVDDYDGDPTKWSSYSLDPSNPTYRETVLHLPPNNIRPSANGYWEVVRGTGRPDVFADEATARAFAAENGGEARPKMVQQVADAATDFRQHHFPDQPNVIGHMMTSMVRHEGKPVYLIDQIQSDWGQKLRDGGVRDEAKIAELRQRVDFLKRQEQEHAKTAMTLRDTIAERNGLHTSNGTNAQGWLLGRSREALPASDLAEIGTFFDKMNAINDERRLLEAELRTAEAATPGNPLVDTTDQWVNTTLRRAIRQAAEADAEYIAIPHGDTVLSYNPGKQSEMGTPTYGNGMRSFYGTRSQDGIVPKNLRKLIEKLDKEAPRPIRVTEIDTPQGKQAWNTKEAYPFKKEDTGFTVFPLTDKIKNEVKERGQVMFAFAGEKAKTLPNPEPKIPAGHVRLYRAESTRTAQISDWIRQSEDYQRSQQASGRWFTDTKDNLDFYINDIGPDHRVVYIDVPSEVAQRFRVANLDAKSGGKETADNPLAFSRDPLTEYFLPADANPKKNVMFAFAGERAKTADREALARAKEMDADGVDRTKIWSDTGWFRGVDGKWRFEIDDSGARLRSNEEVAAIGDSMVQGAKELEGRVKQSNVALREQPDLFPAALKRVHADMRKRAKGMREKAGENFGPTWNEYTGRRLEYDLDHQAMLAAYPQLGRDLVISRPGPSQYSPSLKGSYTDNRIKLNGPRNSDQTSTTLHETQHALQDVEGFATGGSPESAYMTDGLRQQWAQEIDKILQPAPYEKFAANPVWDGVAEPEIRRQYKVMVDEMRAASKDIYHPLSKQVQQTAAYNIYRRLAGETEARNVQTRRDFSPAERKANRPWETQDVPDDQQIVRFGGGKAESRPPPKPPAQGKGRPKPPRPVLGGRVIKQVQQAAKSLPPEVRAKLKANALLPVGARKSAVEATGDDPSMYRMAAPFQNAKPGPIMRQAERIPTISGKTAFPRPANPIDERVNASLDRIERNVGPPRSLDPIAEAAGIAEKRRRAAVAEASRWNAKTNTQTREAMGLPDAPIPKSLARNEQEATELAIAAKRALAAANLETTSAQEARAWAEQRKEAIIQALLGQSDGAKPVGVMGTRMQVGGASSKVPPVRPPKPVSYQDARDMADLLFEADNAKMLEDVLSGRVKPKNRDDHHMALLMLGGATGLGITGLAIANDAPEPKPSKDNYDPQVYMDPGDPRYVWDWEKMKTNRQAVQAIQVNLNALPPNADGARYNLSVDAWGRKTEAALKHWQYENGFNPDGVMTAEQWELLDSQALAARRNEPARTGQRR
jgi:hypothetical protein